MTNHKYFSWHDCWVITGILWTIRDEAEVDLSAIIAAGDMLNHAIYTEKELKDGFYKAQKKGILSIHDNKIKIKDKGKEIRGAVQKMRGGLFSIVDNMQKKLNSNRTKLMDMPEAIIDPCNFITDTSVKDGHKKYLQIFEKSR